MRSGYVALREHYGKPDVEGGLAGLVRGQSVREAVPQQHLTHQQQADALAAFLGAEEGGEQLAGRHASQARTGIDDP